MVNNKGYTLIELILVIAIMAILSGASFLTIGIIKEAKRQSAASTLDNQISSCLIKTKAVSPGMNGKEASLCMVIRKRTDGAYAVLNGYMQTGNLTDATGSVLNPDEDEDCEVVLSKEISNIIYKPSDAKQQLVANDMVIQFIKSDGSTQYGGGAFELYKKNGDLYATIYLDKVSGNHYIK